MSKLSYKEYAGDGTTVQFTFDLEYILTSYIHAYVYDATSLGWPVDDDEVSFTWINATTIELAAAPAVGMTLRIARVTSRERLVDYQASSTLTESDMDQDSNQLMHVAQEVDERADDQLSAVEDAIVAAEDAQDAAEAAQATAAAASATAVAAQSAAEAASAEAVAAAASVDADNIVHITGSESISGNKTFTGVVLGAAPRGWIKDLIPYHVDDATVRLFDGEITINGVVYYLESSIDVTMPSATSAWVFLMAAAPGSGQALTSGCLTVDTTAPTWATAKHGYYDSTGNKRMVAPLYLDGDGDLVIFTMTNDWFQLADGLELYSAAPPATLTGLNCKLPSALQAHNTVLLTTFHTDSVAAISGLNIVNGTGTDSAGQQQVSRQSVVSGGAVGDAKRSTDGSGNVKILGTATATSSVWLLGFGVKR